MRRMQQPPPVPRPAGARGSRGEVIFEFVAIGNSVKVSAVDPYSMLEVSIVGPVTAGEDVLRRTALAKLEHVRARRQREAAGGRSGLYA